MRGVSRRSSGPGRCRTTVRSRPTSLVFFIPGFLGLSRRAFGQAPNTLVPHEPIGHIDILMVQALALWTALLIVVVSALADVALAVLDPRVRSSGRPVG